MPLTFPLTGPGLEVDVFVTVEDATLDPLRQAGAAPPPIPARALIDTGSDLTVVSPAILQRLGIPFVFQTTTHGVGGSVSVNLYRVGLNIIDSRNVSLPWLMFATLLVMELPGIPFDVLIGLDIIRACKLNIDGPAGLFTLE